MGLLWYYRIDMSRAGFKPGSKVGHPRLNHWNDNLDHLANTAVTAVNVVDVQKSCTFHRARKNTVTKEVKTRQSDTYGVRNSELL